MDNKPSGIVLPFIRAGAPKPDAETVAPVSAITGHLRAIATMMDAGGFPPASRAVLVLDCGEGVATINLLPALTPRADVASLLCVAAAAALGVAGDAQTA
jgi:hypothetical protein